MKELIFILANDADSQMNSSSFESTLTKIHSEAFEAAREADLINNESLIGMMSALTENDIVRVEPPNHYDYDTYDDVEEDDECILISSSNRSDFSFKQEKQLSNDNGKNKFLFKHWVQSTNMI